MTIPDDCTVRLVDLPVNCGGMVSMSPDGHYSIFLNSRLNHETQFKKLKHEIYHIENDDFHNADPIQTVESRASANPVAAVINRHSLPPLLRASDLLNDLASKSLPQRPEGAVQGKVAAPPALTDEVASPRSPVPLTPYQSSLLLRCLRDLDAFLLRDDPYLY